MVQAEKRHGLGWGQSVTVLTAGIILAAGLLSMPTPIFAARAEDAVTLRIDTEASYRPAGADTTALDRNLTVFRARRQAADQAADEFARRRLIQFVDRDKDELVLLVADRLTATVDESRGRSASGAPARTIQLHALVRLSDFIEAELTSLRLKKEEAHEDYRSEMEPNVSPALTPGHLLARAYRLVDKNEPRMAIIYLDNLIHHYPGWRELYETKAMALRLQDRPEQMEMALHQACTLGSPTACTRLEQRQAVKEE
ncbi:hypothetical protein [Desulfosarcina ovata]|uniref:Uncharacterized protein n=1 Tax=Desulfosarcina ovata subsp. ovata TaxID=2752305 RepID=A0A5K8AG77_9BACT|nr:hypothetical protein [Desulfosarcina ovata]BBO91558.1 hypothetical protein DSCOOX_47380 [Desulfosarcina ovata subsp. ovata]